MDGTRLALLLNPLAERNGYKRNDGQAFANDLLARNASATQLAKGTKAIAQAIMPWRKRTSKWQSVLSTTGLPQSKRKPGES